MYPLALLHCLIVNNYYSNNILPLIENWKLSLSEYKKTLYTNRNASIYLGLFDANKSVVSDVYTLFKGKMYIMKIDEGAETASITLNIENRLIVFDRPKERRFTHEDQQNRFAGDLGFEFVPDLQDKEIIWGKKGS